MATTPTDQYRFARRMMLLCCHCVRNIGYYRMGYVNEKGTGALKDTTEFGATVNGNMLDVAVLEWCKLFADEKGRHHWKKFIRERDAQDRFHRQLRKKLSLTNDQWNDYDEQVTHYRDKFVAHLDQLNKMNIPRLQAALDATLFLYAHVREILPADCLQSPHWQHLPVDLNDYYTGCCDEARAAYRRT
jgi:hypothetical protein